MDRSSETAAPQLSSPAPGRYREFTPVGEGGQGIVYLAIDTELAREVAFKVLRPPAEDPAAEVTPEAPFELRAPAAGSNQRAEFEGREARFLQEAWIAGGLEHPGIVPVYELGRTAEGVPYYTMRYVRGSRTLADALDELRERPLAERLELLEPFLTVCDALGHAHERGVVHRDLKPANVALGEHGEAVVLDWGLAKLAGRPDLLAERWRERVEERRAGSGLRTRTSALGTPGYLSPEAARGAVDEVGAASDVYSLGAILFEVLTGRRPFAFEHFDEYAARVVAEGAPDARALAPDVPAALAALCARALSRDPAERPPGAGAIAAGIRAWRRRAARLRTVLRVGAVAAGVIAVVAVVAAVAIERRRREAVEARAEAVAASARAEELMGFLVFELQERLEPLGRSDLLGELADRARAYYEELPVESSTPAALTNRTVALRNLGDVHRARGDLSAALAAYRAAGEVARRLVERTPESAEAHFHRSLAAGREGGVLGDQGRTTQALVVLEAHRAEVEPLSAAETEGFAYRGALAAAHAYVADALGELGRWSEALASQERALALTTELAALAPGTGPRLAWRRDVALSHLAAARALLEMSEREPAVERGRLALELAEELCAEHPGDLRWRELRVRCRLGLGKVFHQWLEHGTAREHFAAAAEEARALVAHDPTHRGWRGTLARALALLADTRPEEPAGNHALRVEALALLDGLLAEDPTHARWRNQEITLLDRLAIEEPARAALRRTRAVESARFLIEQDPENFVWRHVLAYTTYALGRRLLLDGEREGGRELLAESLAIGDPLLEESPANFELAVMLALARSALAGSHADEPARAAALLDHAARDIERMRERVPDAPLLVEMLAELERDRRRLGAEEPR